MKFFHNYNIVKDHMRKSGTITLKKCKISIDKKKYNNNNNNRYIIS